MLDAKQVQFAAETLLLKLHHKAIYSEMREIVAEYLADFQLLALASNRNEACSESAPASA